MNKKQNAEEDYDVTSISVLSYIGELERQIKEDRRDYLKDTRVLLKQLEELDKDNRALLDSNLELIKELREARLELDTTYDFYSRLVDVVPKDAVYINGLRREDLADYLIKLKEKGR